ELARRIYQHWYDVGVLRLYVANVTDKTAVTYVLTCDERAYTNNVISCLDVAARAHAQGRVEAAGRVPGECIVTVSRIRVAECVTEEGNRTNCRVRVARRVRRKRAFTSGCIAAAP